MVAVAGLLAVSPFVGAQTHLRAQHIADAPAPGTPDIAATPFAASILRSQALRHHVTGGWGSSLAASEASAQSPWASFDKLQHVTFSFLMTIGAQYTLVNKFDVSSASATPVSAGSSLAVGVAKELYDKHRSPSGRFDGRDLVADLVGVTLGVVLILI